MTINNRLTVAARREPIGVRGGLLWVCRFYDTLTGTIIVDGDGDFLAAAGTLTEALREGSLVAQRFHPGAEVKIRAKPLPPPTFEEQWESKVRG